MVFDNKLYTSLVSIQRDLDIISVWNKLDIFIRDANPNRILFTDEYAKFYDILKNPSGYFLVEEDSMAISENRETDKIPINISKEAYDVLLTLHPALDRLRLFALAQLLMVDINRDLINRISYKVSYDEPEVYLKYGEGLKLSSLQLSGHDIELSTKKIIVDISAKKPSRIGSYVFSPGSGTYGVFQRDKLVAFCPNEISNSNFLLKTEIVDVNQIIVKAINLKTSTVCRSYKDCTFFSVLGPDNFVVVNAGRVECYNNQPLQNVIDKNVGILDEPQYLYVDEVNRILNVILKNCETIKITY